MATALPDIPPPPYEDDDSAIRKKTITMPFDESFATCPCCELLTMGSNGCLHCSYTRRKCDKCQIQMDEGVVRLRLVLCKICASASSSESPTTVERVQRKDAYKKRRENPRSASLSCYS